MRAKLFYLVLILTISVPGLARAQQDAATIVGEVTDASRAIVPKAVVMVTNIATGITSTSETNDRGLYNVPGLRPGEYVVTVEAPGFSKFVRSGVTLQVAQVLQLDAGLQAGSIQESVEVKGAAPMRSRFALQQQVFEAKGGDRNTLRIGVVVLAPLR